MKEKSAKIPEKQIRAIIFDMDGTLYQFDQSTQLSFWESQLGKRVRINILQFLQEELGSSLTQAEQTYLDLKRRYNDQLSLAVEKEFRIPRSDFFDRTWNIPAKELLSPDSELRNRLYQLNLNLGILTSAPRVWTNNMLHFLNLQSIFGDAVFTGEPDVRKPMPEAFLQLSTLWNLEPSQILAIGDQEESDILPAKSLGMRTVRITQNDQTQADFVAPNLPAALKLLKKKGIL